MSNPPAASAVVCSPREHRKWAAPGPLRYWHLASFDAPTVAVVWAYGFAWAARTRAPLWSYLLLGLIVWAIYIVDRLLDTRSTLRKFAEHSLQDRHWFHWRHRRTFVPLAAGAGAVAAAIVFLQLPVGALRQDSVVALGALMYFSGVHFQGKLSRSLPAAPALPGTRELAVGVLFAAGCSLPVWSQLSLAAGVPLPNPLLLLAVLFYAALAWLNVRAIGIWEADELAGQARLVLAAGLILATIGLGVAVILSPYDHRFAALMAAGAVSSSLLAGLDWCCGRLTSLALRAAADLVLLTPLFLTLSSVRPR